MRAQSDFPSRPIRLVVPFPAGGGIDITARAAAHELGSILGQQIVVQNQGGAGGALATDAVVKADPDGYTLLYHSTTGIVHAAVTDKLPYDWMRDLLPVAIVTRFAPVMVASPTLPSKNLKDFIALLKANPGKYSFASSGQGTAVHLAAELFRQKAGVDMVHVPYRGTVAAMPDLLAGRIAMMVDGVPVQTPNIRQGTILALAVTTDKRSPAIPDVPTMKEMGVDVEVPFWTAIYAPAKHAEAGGRKAAGGDRQDHARGRRDQAARRRRHRVGGIELGRARRADQAAVRALSRHRPGQPGAAAAAVIWSNLNLAPLAPFTSPRLRGKVGSPPARFTRVFDALRRSG